MATVLQALGLTLAGGPQNWAALDGGYPVMVANAVSAQSVLPAEKEDKEIARAALAGRTRMRPAIF